MAAVVHGIAYCLMSLIYEHLDMLLALCAVSVKYENGEWLYVIHDVDCNVFVHGAKPYTRDEAYADALASLLSLPSIADGFSD